ALALISDELGPFLLEGVSKEAERSGWSWLKKKNFVLVLKN
ncbi:hypothetical protein CEXT_120291, partial [Caerostris extrusa]